MKKVLLLQLACILAAATITNVCAQGPEQLTIALTNPGKPYTLQLGLVHGSIKVTGYNGSDIQLEASSTDKNNKEHTEDAGNGMKRIIPGGGYELKAKEENNRVTINTEFNRNIVLTLKVPQDVKLKLSTVNDGTINVDNVKGELEINNVNGGIKLQNISGSAVASTVNGDVVVTFDAVDASTPMAFTTLNGNVDVSLPTAVKSNIKVKSDRGEIFTDFDVSIDNTPADITKSKADGMQRLKKEDWVKGKINGGGPEIMLKNMNGNIYVRKTRK